MSEENLAGIHLRLVQLAAATGVPGNDLETMTATELPQGAFAWCNNVATLYRLDKFSTLASDGQTIVTARGGGNWIAVTSGTEALYSAFVQWDVVAGSATAALVQSTWTALPSAASNFSTLNAAQGAVWGVNTTSGLLTYSGPTRSYQFTAQLTAFATTGTTTNYGFGVSRSDAPIIGGTTDPKFESQQECAAQEERTWSITGALADLIAGQTVQGCIRNNDGTEALTILRYTMVLTPMG